MLEHRKREALERLREIAAAVHTSSRKRDGSTSRPGPGKPGPGRERLARGGDAHAQVRNREVPDLALEDVRRHESPFVPQ